MRSVITRCTLALLLAPPLTFAPLASALAQQKVLRQEIGNLILENIPPRDEALAEKLDRYLQARGARFLDWLPDGSMLIATRFGDVDQVHRVASPLGMREQLTYFREPITVARAPQVAPAAGFVFLKDRGGDENAQLHYFNLEDRTVRLLTDGKSRHGSIRISNDGRRVAFYGTGRDGVSHDIYVVDLAAGTEPRLVVAAQREAWRPLDWSADNSRLLLIKEVSIHESYLFVADANTGSLRPLEPKPGAIIGIGDAIFAPDGRGVLLTSDEDSEFRQLRYMDMYTLEPRVITGEIPWDVEAFDASDDGRYIAYVTNENGRSRLTVLDNEQKLELSPPGVPVGIIDDVRFDRSGRRLAFTVQSAQSPRDVYVFDLARNAVERWTHSEVGPVDGSSFVTPELIRYPTWDRVGRQQRMISAYVYRPRTQGPHPVLINIHGGPESQYRPGFEPFMQFLVNELGFVVIAPNVRGSAGYGKSFLKLDNGMLREDAVKDIGSLLVWIGLQPSLDSKRIFVAGGSYGGYMALASMAAYSDRLRGGVDIVGISNFVTFLTNTSPYRQDLRRAEYGDERDPRMRRYLTRISPLSNAVAIRKPLLVVQGMNDPRVPASESEQMVARIRANGGEVWYLAAKDEGHGFRKKPNRDFYLLTMAMFLRRLAAR